MIEQWLKEAKREDSEHKNGMYLFHIGIVRSTSRQQARNGIDSDCVIGMKVSINEDEVENAKKHTLKMNGIRYVRIHINSGCLKTGDEIMNVLVGGDIRPNVVSALEFLVGTIKTKCITEQEYS